MRLIAENISIARGGQVFFSEISFTLSSGEALIVSGPNGVGKSTLLRVLAGLLPDADGIVRIEGGDYERSCEACHYLGHRNGMKHELSVRENLDFWCRYMASSQMTENTSVHTTAEAVRAVGLEGLEHFPFGYLSAGQQRRIAMARLLTVHRPVWILDEPTAALDVDAQAMFSNLVANHLEYGGMVIAATHQPLRVEAASSLKLSPAGTATFGNSDLAVTAGAG